MKKSLLSTVALIAYSSNIAMANSAEMRMIEIYDGHSDITSALSLFENTASTYKYLTENQYVSGIERTVNEDKQENFRATTNTVTAGLSIEIQEVEPKVFQINIWHGDKPTFKSTVLFGTKLETPYQSTYRLETKIKLNNEQTCLPVSGEKRKQSVCFKVIS